MARALGLWTPVLAWMSVLFYASAQSDTGALGRVPDWITHGAVYLILSLLVCRALAGGVLLPLSARAAVVAVALCTAYGVSDEYHQSFVPGRDSSAGDVAKDCGGATLAALLWRRLAAGSTQPAEASR